MCVCVLVWAGKEGGWRSGGPPRQRRRERWMKAGWRRRRDEELRKEERRKEQQKVEGWTEGLRKAGLGDGRRGGE